MANWLIIALVGIVAFIIGFFIEVVRDFYEEAWETIRDAVTSFFSFEWISEIPEFFGSMFENISEFSVFGLAFGGLATGLIFVLRNNMIQPFVQHFSPTGRIFWTVATYITVFIGGYFMGKHFENT